MPHAARNNAVQLSQMLKDCARADTFSAGTALLKKITPFALLRDACRV